MGIKPTVIVITGPTASGKSGVGILLAKKLNTKIISADSMQIYKGLDIGTAKVTSEMSEGIEHLLIDLCDITENFSVAEYKKLCYEKIDEILKEGKTPIIVGGTGLYINATVNNMNFIEEDVNQHQIIEEKVEDLKRQGVNLYEYLKNIDEEAAMKITPNNTKRIIRAIKIYFNGINKSSIDNKKDLWVANESKYNFFVVYIDMPRNLLYDRINQRVNDMVSDGIIDEAQMLFEMKTSCSSTVYQAIGYKEFFSYFKGEESLERSVELLKQKTRNYAKRQITWFKKLPNKFIVDGTKTKEKIVFDIMKEYYEKINEEN